MNKMPVHDRKNKYLRRNKAGILKLQRICNLFRTLFNSNITEHLYMRRTWIVIVFTVLHIYYGYFATEEGHCPKRPENSTTVSFYSSVVCISQSLLQTSTFFKPNGIPSYNLPAFGTAWRWGFLHLFDPALAPRMRQLNQQNKLYEDKQKSASQSKVHPHTVKGVRLGYQ